MLLYAFLVIFFAWYKEYINWRILFNKFSDVLIVCTCMREIGNLWSICLWLKILSHSPWVVLYLELDANEEKLSKILITIFCAL